MTFKTTTNKWLTAVVLSLATCFLSTALYASDDELNAVEVLNKKFSKQKFSKKGADTCMKCHDAQATVDATPIYFTSHGRRQVTGGAMQIAQCETCHGPDDKHSKSRLRKNETREVVVGFGQTSETPIAKQNEICLSCHTKEHGNSWQLNAHNNADVACASCHSIHSERDPVLTLTSQNQVCTNCHTDVKAKIHQRSNHPLKWQQMQCTDCHELHGNEAEDKLLKATLNDTCFTCHPEKRGPFLWEHGPVVEDCSLCHDSHGSVNNDLLKRRVPQLCQNCHNEVQHNSYAFTEVGSNSMIAGKSCLNCHSAVHGSHHPSGNLLQR